jgi:5-formyltetrahydrofolate cyclo-ligase
VTGPKEALRERMRGIRASIPAQERVRRAQGVHSRLFSLPEMARARSVLLFYSFGSEVATAGMAARVTAEGRRLLLPFLEEGAMEAAEVLPGERLEPSGYGPREPARRVAVDPNSVDLVVSPGLAFDRSGRRLGYGGGHYDRYLARVGHHAARVGVCFAAQLVDEVPEEPGDQRVELIITEDEVIDCRAGRGTDRPL